MLTSYAQNFEDVILWRALKHIEKGFYIDIGAQDPIVDSVSLAFYEMGWRGVHVEPVPFYAAELRRLRPDEETVQAAVGEGGGNIPLFEIAGTGLSTADRDIAALHIAAGYETKQISVPLVRLAELLKLHAAKDIHWLKIDAEGMENSVIDSWRPSAVRPWIVVVEATKPNLPDPNHEKWEATLISYGLRCALTPIGASVENGLGRVCSHNSIAISSEPSSDPPLGKHSGGGRGEECFPTRCATRVSRWVPYFCFNCGAALESSCRGKGGRSMWTTLFTIVLVLAATLNVLAIVSEYIAPES